MANNYIKTPDFVKTTKYLYKLKNIFTVFKLERYAEEGLRALMAHTPVDTGLTAHSWRYEITTRNDITKIQYYNSHINKYVSIAMILQYGHATRNGGWVEGVDYINPALKPVFNKLVEELWKEVIRV